MARHIWTGAASGDLNTAGNWSGGVPVADGHAIVDNTDQSITTSMNALAAVEGIHWYTGPNFSGTIGSAANPLELGQASATPSQTIFAFNGRKCQGCWFDPTLGVARNSPYVKVYGTSEYPNSLVLQAGSAKEVNILGGQNITLESTIAIEDYLRLLSNFISLLIKDNAVFTGCDIEMNGGSVVNYADIVNLYMQGGTWDHRGSTNGDITLLHLNSAEATFLLNSKGATITAFLARKGLIDHRYAGPVENTITNGTLLAGARVLLENGHDTLITSNAIKNYGGVLEAGPSVLRDDQFGGPGAA